MSSLRQNIIALFIGLLLIVGVEGLFLLGGVQPLSEEDRFVDFSGNTPLFVPTAQPETGYSEYALNPVKEPYFNSQNFLMPKPEGLFRLISLGGSTTYGRPYTGQTAFSHWLVALGNRFAGAQRYEQINAGGISYASYRADRLQQELVRYNPDLFVVYSGHNEFLEARTFAALKEESSSLSEARKLLHHSRIYSSLARIIGKISNQTDGVRSVLPDEVAPQLETVVGPDAYHRDEQFRNGVISQYSDSLQRMIDRAKKYQVPLVLCTLPSNLSGVSPFKSEHRTGINTPQLAKWNLLFRNGTRALAAGDAGQAVTLYQQALRIDARYALLHYRYGQALLQAGDTKQAYQAFVRAKQEDIVPLRALDEINAVIRERADRNNVPLADVEAVFRRVSNNGIPGNDLFDDHVHPNIRGQQLVAWVIFDTLVKYQIIPLDYGQWQRQVSEARNYLRAQEEKVSPRYRALGQWGVGRLYFWAAKYPEAYRSLQQAWGSVKDIAEIPFKLGALEVFRGDGEAAVVFLDEALRLEPGNLDAVVMLANAYLLSGQPEQALNALETLPAGRDKSLGYLSARGRAWIMTGHIAEGLSTLEDAYHLNSKVPRSAREYAEALALSGNLPRAKEVFTHYLHLLRLPDPDAVTDRWIAQKGWQNPRHWLQKELRSE